jgi:Ser/Thr protein kinase RdoA (MazF antagonist)
MSEHVWGDEATEFFYELTPEKILDTIDEAGYHCTGRLTALNSMENRVYDIEIENTGQEAPKNSVENFRVAKFYRPGRWSVEQILEEHQFLLDLKEQEIPVIAPLPFADGRTLQTMKDSNIHFTLFPKMGGRAPDELNDPQLAQLGRLLARAHNVGENRDCVKRLEICPQTYGFDNLNALLDDDTIPKNHEIIYRDLVEKICDDIDPLFDDVNYQRIHGDCHLGNVIWRQEEAWLLDFDDMLRGPCVQDIWLLVPGRDAHALAQREVLLKAYEEMRPFDRKELKLIEPLRTLRFIHFTAWISKRYEDPAFKRMFPDFGSNAYWQEQIMDLREQMEQINSVR